MNPTAEKLLREWRDRELCICDVINGEKDDLKRAIAYARLQMLGDCLQDLREAFDPKPESKDAADEEVEDDET